MSQSCAFATSWRARGRRALAALLVLFAFAGSPAWAVDLRPGEPATVPGGEIAYLADPDHTLDPAGALAGFDAGEGRLVGSDIADFGAVFATYWLLVPLENAGERAGTWTVATRAPFFPAVTIHLRRADGTLDEVLDNTVDDPFDARPQRFRTVLSAPFSLQPGERADLVVGFEAAGVANFAFTLESEQSLSALREEDAAISGIFHAFSIAAILFFAVFSIAVRFGNGLLYAALFAIALLLNAQLDGLAFQLLWPDWPGWNGIAALVLMNLLCGFGFYVAARQRERERPSPRFRRAAYALAVVSLAVNGLIPLIGPGAVVMIGNLLFVAMLAAQAAALLPWLRRPDGGVGRPALVGTVLVAGASLGLAILYLSGVTLPPLVGYNLHRIYYLVITLTTMATLVGIVVQLRRDHESALSREVEAARRDAALNRELFEAEKNYAQARELAAQRQRRLATASHDIKQPLAALRLSMDALTAGDDPETRRRLKDAFDYLEGLTGSYLVEARPEEAGEGEIDAAVKDAGAPAEPYPLSLITGTVEQVFREEAVSKGLRFTCTGDDREIAVPVLPLLRLVSNLTSNAVKYTVEGGVSVSAGAAGEGAFIAVEDTGPGMSADALALYRRSGEKGETSQGEGLGMAIADEIAASLGLTLEVESTLGEGTRFRVLIP